MAVLQDHVALALRAVRSFYGYIPDKGIAITFLALFGLSTLIHVGQAIAFKRYWLLGTAVMCGVIELMGWGARLWSHYEPGNPKPYEMQLTCTILAPTPLLAANFLIMERLILRLGTGFSRLSPKWYTILFCSCDVISLVVQAIGGGTAAKAVAKGTNPEIGGHIMLGGIVFQMVTITVYTVCATEYFWRYLSNAPLPGKSALRGALTPKLKLQSFGLLFSTTCMFIRAVYRTIELIDGWTGRIITTEIYFNVLDGAMIVLAIYTSNILHPGILLKREEKHVNAMAMELKEATEHSYSTLAT